MAITQLDLTALPGIRRTFTPKEEASFVFQPGEEWQAKRRKVQWQANRRKTQWQAEPRSSRWEFHE